MKILGIETSCDETAAAVVEDGTKILSNVVATSQDMHAKTGGIIPEQAARAQVKSIIPVVGEALFGQGIAKEDIDAIAVTVGPGLIGSLLVGVETAKTLSWLWNKPLIPVNHLVGHIYANWLDKDKNSVPQFPALALVVSGGHTDLVLMSDHGLLEWIGGTRDDAAGEAFDKTARLLGLGYPGGPAISAAAEKYLAGHKNEKLNLFPRPLIDEDNLDWSFSGLKTAVLREVTKTKLSKERLAAEIQEAIVDVLVYKTKKAVVEFNPQSILFAGGVAANSRLKKGMAPESFSNTHPVAFHVPKPSLCTDNAAYIASAAFFNNHPKSWQSVNANPELEITSML